VHYRPDLVHAEIVIPWPRLVSPQAGDPADDGRAVVILALVGVDLREVDLREMREFFGDLGGGELPVAGDCEVSFRGQRALDLTLGLRDPGYLACFAGGAFCTRCRVTSSLLHALRRRVGRVGSTSPADVVRSVP